jgi:hypothetical protein
VCATNLSKLGILKERRRCKNLAKVYYIYVFTNNMSFRGGDIMKKLWIILICALLIPAAVNTAESKIELTYWTHEDPNRTEIENRYIKEFEASNRESGTGYVQFAD